MNIGEKVPEVLGINEKREKILLSQYQGKKVVLYFYPKDERFSFRKKSRPRHMPNRF